MRADFFGCDCLAYANKANPAGHPAPRKKFFGYRTDESDTYASANLRMWRVILSASMRSRSRL